VAQSSRAHKQSTTYLTVMILAGILVGSAIGYVRIKEAPRYDLYQFKRALLRHDAQGALRYLDTDALIENAFTETFNKADPTEKNTVARRIITQNLPSLKKQLRDQIVSYISSPDHSALFDNVSQVSIFGLSITQRGDSAAVKVRGSDTVAFRMAKSPQGNWKVIAVNIDMLQALTGMNK